MKKGTTLLLLALIYFTTHGQQWQSVGPLGFSSVSAGQPQIMIDQLGSPRIQYYSASSGETYVESWNGSVWQNVGGGAVTPALSPPIQSAEMAADNSNNLYLAYKNGAVDGWKCGVKMWNGSAWSQFGSDNFSPGQASFLDIAISSSDEVYVLIADQFYRLSVMKNNGSGWTAVGNTYITPSQAYGSSLALDDNDVPYVCYSDSTQSQLLSLIKFNGTAWVFEGSPGISPAASGNCDLLFDNSNDPVVAYRANSNNKLYVIRDNGTGWTVLGGLPISAGATNQPNIAVNSLGELYVTCRDDGASSKARLWKYNGTTWDLVGGNQLSTGLGDFPTVSFDQNDVPFVAFRDNDQSGQATVMKYCATEANLNITTCESPYTSPSGNHTYFGSGFYKDTIQNVNGCDSVLNITLTINTSNISAFAWYPNLCTGDSTPVFVSMNGAATYTWSHGLGMGDSVMYYPTSTDTLTVIGDDGAGCVDSVDIPITLWDKPIVTITQSDTNVCLGDSIFITNSGAYSYNWSNPLVDTLTAQWYTAIYAGPWTLYLSSFDSSGYCYSFDSLIVNGSNGPSGLSGGIGSGVNMYVIDNGYTYEWYLDGNLIPGATSEQYTATQNGDYVVFVYDSTGCPGQLSWTVTAVGAGLDDVENAILVYPVPFNDKFFVELDHADEIILQDISGKVIYSEHNVDGTCEIETDFLAPGTFYLSVVSEGITRRRLVIKQ